VGGDIIQWVVRGFSGTGSLQGWGWSLHGAGVFARGRVEDCRGLCWDSAVGDGRKWGMGRDFRGCQREYVGVRCVCNCCGSVRMVWGVYGGFCRAWAVLLGVGWS